MPAPKTIAVAGFQHETNTFAPHLADFHAFERPDGWPALTCGDALYDVMRGLNIPLGGYMARAEDAGHEMLPLCWCNAVLSASAPAGSDAFLLNAPKSKGTARPMAC